jgi:hypothetical protein
VKSHIIQIYLDVALSHLSTQNSTLFTPQPLNNLKNSDQHNDNDNIFNNQPTSPSKYSQLTISGSNILPSSFLRHPSPLVLNNGQQKNIDGWVHDCIHTGTSVVAVTTTTTTNTISTPIKNLMKLRFTSSNTHFPVQVAAKRLSPTQSLSVNRMKSTLPVISINLSFHKHIIQQ